MNITAILEKQKSFYQSKHGRLVKCPMYEYLQIVNGYAKSLIRDVIQLDHLDEGFEIYLDSNEGKKTYKFDDLTLNQSIEIASEIGVEIGEIFSNPDHMIVEGFDGADHVFSLQAFETRDRLIYLDFADIIVQILKLEVNNTSHIFVPEIIASNLAGCVLEIRAGKIIDGKTNNICVLIPANSKRIDELHSFYA